ncbi:MAG: DoxX family protein [Myxococcota bacterium]
MRWLTWSPLGRLADVGNLLLRVGLGAAMVVHGWPKVAGGEPTWRHLGAAMGNLGITFAPTFWGAMAAFSEFAGGALLIVGLATRPAAAALAFTMFVATLMHVGKGDDFGVWSHAAELGVVFVGFMGPGRLSLDRRLDRGGA